MRSRLLLLALSTFATVFSVGCDDGDSVEPTMSSIHDKIISRSCNSESCHGGTSPKGSLDLSTPQSSYDGLVGITADAEPSYTLVVAGDPDNSLFYLILLGDVGAIDQMPTGFELDAEEVEAVRQWIEDGAENN